MEIYNRMRNNCKSIYINPTRVAQVREYSLSFWLCSNVEGHVTIALANLPELGVGGAEGVGLTPNGRTLLWYSPTHVYRG